MPSASSPTAAFVAATVDSLRPEFPGWRLEVNIAEDGTPSVCAYLFWQAQGAESYTLAFVPDENGAWVALNSQGEMIEDLDAGLASSVRAMLGRLGMKQVS
ncbi:MAG: hypothetical protein K0R27_738 [Xanthobacteraceae bacterium]|nr:hypothetical protein [Xanthobacteraceae bacterium]